MGKRKKSKYRSKLEGKIAKDLAKHKVPFEYEQTKIDYVIHKSYTLDFAIGDILIEVKGYFRPSDRRKHLAIKKQHPDLDLRFIFQRDNYLTKAKSGTYSSWCETHGFKYHIGEKVPLEWIEEAQI